MLNNKRGLIKHIFQPNGISCGNTVLKMVAEYLDIGHNTNIEDLMDIMGTDAYTGTTDIKMIKGLKFLNIDYIQNIHHEILMNDDIQLEILKSIINKNKIFIMRTLTKGVLHWILVYDYKHDTQKYKVNDPWLGELEYSSEQIMNIWRPRDYDGFII